MKVLSTYAEYESWINENKEIVLKYIDTNDVLLSNIMSARTFNVMRINGLHKMSDIIFLCAEEIDKLDMIDKNVLNETLMFKRNFLKKHKTAIIDYVCGTNVTDITRFDSNEYSKQDESLDTINNHNSETVNGHLPLTLAYVKTLLQDETFKSKLRNFLMEKNVEIADLNMSVRSYNALRRGKIKFLHEAVFYYPDKFDDFRNLGRKSIDEICHIIEEYVSSNYSEFETFDNTGIVPCEKSLEDESDPFSLSIKQLLLHPKYKDKAVEFLNANEILVEEMMLSNRSVGALKRAGHNTFLDVLKIYPNDIASLQNIGAKSIDDIKERTEFYISKLQHTVSTYCSGDSSAMYSDDFVFDKVMSCFENAGFRGISFKEIVSVFPENFDESRIKKCIGTMLADRKLEYVDFRLYRVYPSVFKAINGSLLDLDNKEIMLERFKGVSLEEIGKQLNLTRERVRQKYSKSIDKLRVEIYGKYGSKLFDEDYYAYLYSNYEVTKELWLDFLGVSDATFGYLTNSLSKGTQTIENALNDSNVDLNLKFKIQDYLNRNKIMIDGNFIENQRAYIEDYALAKLCREETTYDNFAELYNALLKENGIDFDEKIYYTDEVRRTRGNRLTDSKLCLWKQGEKLRYYDIVGQDYTELFETINLSQFSNIEISTLKFFEDFPELMEKYDIRDQYELHNLLKKIIDVKDYNDISFGRQPTIRFGEFDRDRAMYDILEAVSPVTTEDLVEYIHMEYGYDRATTAASYLKSLNQYYHKGVYSIDFKKIPDDRIEFFKEALTEEFYYISEIKKLYKELFEGADAEDINPLSLKSLGFTVLGTYAIQNFGTAEAYFTHVLTKDDVYDISVYNKKFANTKSYYCVSRDLRMNYDILLFEPDRAITMNRLNKLGISKEDIKVFCDEVEAFADSDSYFTMHSLRDDGFTSKLDDLGFDDYFYAMLLAADPRYLWQRVFGEIVLSVKSRSLENIISTKSFLLSVLSEYDSVDIDDFIDDCTEKYGVRIPERYEVMEAISNTDFYYDRIMDKLYKNKSVYYEEFDD